MADFRRRIPAFAALVLVLGFEAPASAQYGIVCNSQFSGPNLRAEGYTELTGEIDLVCSPAAGAVPTPAGQPIARVTITVSLSAPLTSRFMGSSGTTEALLTIDTPIGAQRHICLSPTTGACPVTGDGGLPFNHSTKYNVFQGITSGPGSRSVTFLGVPVDPPAMSTRIYRIQNLRVNATNLSASLYAVTLVVASVDASPSTSIQINNPSGNVGYVSSSLSATITPTGGPFLQCLGLPSRTLIGTVTFTELFPSAFKTAGLVPPAQNIPGQVYYTESGLEIVIPGGPGAGTTGQANTGTRLQVAFSNIPAGVNLWVDGWAGIFGVSDAMWAPGAAPPATDDPSIGLQQLSSGTTSSATAVWEVMHDEPFGTDTFTFNIYADFGSTATVGTTLAGVAGFNPQFAAYSSSRPIPQFQNATAATNLLTIALCQTILLFPYVTDFYGFDTGIAISNTSMDSLGSPLGATAQKGTCSVTFYGGGGVATTLGNSGVYSSTSDSALTKGVIPAGQTWAFSLSSIDTGYNSAPTYGTTGYAIATCNFQYGHGYSFVSDTGIRNFAAAYLALVIPDGVARNAQQSALSGGSSGEQLVH